MATDTARVQLELASGRNEITAPFYQTAQRRRSKQFEPDAASVGAPAAQTVIDVPINPASSPVSAATADPELSREQRGRTPWIAFAIALLSVGFAVWWVMAQRMPDIDPRDVIARNLSDARTAIADGRYTDPPERSAFHYYSTVIALDPDNADAVAGIDAIADHHLHNARAMLSGGRIAEAGVALEKARRVRPDHAGLPVLDAQWRAELRQLLAAATSIAKPNANLLERPVVKKAAETSPLRPKVVEPVKASVPKVADVAKLAAAMAANQPSSSLPAPALPVAEPEPAPANIVAEAAPVSAPEPVPVAVEPKLIKMVQPQYPQEALMRGLDGWVEVSLQVSASGDVIEPRIEQASRGRLFNRAALAAVEQWKYEPRSDGTTSERLRVRLRFQHSN